MIITLTGPNTFLLQKELEQLTQKFVDEYGDLALERLDGEEVDFRRLHEAITGLPFLSAKKMVLLRSPSKSKEFTENIETLLADSSDSCDVVIVEPKLDKRLSYFKFLKKSTDYHEFGELDHNGLAQWLVVTAKQQGAMLTSADAHYILERVGYNQQMLSNELQKLQLYNLNISKQTIDILTEPEPQSTIFQLLEAAFAGNKERSMTLYQEQRMLKVEPAQIIAMLAWQLHILAIIKTAADRSVEQIAQQAKLNPFVVRKSQAVAAKLTLVRLRSLVENLLAIDARSKRESIDLDEALQHYLLTF